MSLSNTISTVDKEFNITDIKFLLNDIFGEIATDTDYEEVANIIHDSGRNLEETQISINKFLSLNKTLEEIWDMFSLLLKH